MLGVVVLAPLIGVDNRVDTVHVIRETGDEYFLLGNQIVRSRCSGDG